MNKVVYFDMDGTLADLYKVDNVFKKLDNLIASPYIDALPIMNNIQMLRKYKDNGYKVIILSCLSKITTDEFDKETIVCKDKWLNKYVGKEYIDKRLYIPYTKHKEDYVCENGILVDDDDVILSNWNKGLSVKA